MASQGSFVFLILMVVLVSAAPKYNDKKEDTTDKRSIYDEKEDTPDKQSLYDFYQSYFTLKFPSRNKDDERGERATSNEVYRPSANKEVKEQKEEKKEEETEEQVVVVPQGQNTGNPPLTSYIPPPTPQPQPPYHTPTPQTQPPPQPMPQPPTPQAQPPPQPMPQPLPPRPPYLGPPPPVQPPLRPSNIVYPPPPPPPPMLMPYPMPPYPMIFPTNNVLPAVPNRKLLQDDEYLEQISQVINNIGNSGVPNRKKDKDESGYRDSGIPNRRQ